MDCCQPGSSVHGILQAEDWSRLPFPSPEDLPNLEIKPRSPTLQADSLLSEHQGRLSDSKLKNIYEQLSSHQEW